MALSLVEVEEPVQPFFIVVGQGMDYSIQLVVGKHLMMQGNIALHPYTRTHELNAHLEKSCKGT